MLTGAAALFLIAFFGFVIRHLRDAGRDGGTLPATFQIAAAAVVTSLLFATILEAARAQRIGANADDSTLQAVYAVWLLAFATVNIWILGTALTEIRARTTSHNAVAYRQAEPGAP